VACWFGHSHTVGPPTCECDKRYDEYNEIWYARGVKYTVQDCARLCEVMLTQANKVQVRTRFGLGRGFKYKEQGCSLSRNAVAVIQTQCEMWRELPSSSLDK
jgi:hypothetical protein